MTASRYARFLLLLLAAVSQLSMAQSRPLPTDAADRPVRDRAGRPLEYTTPPVADSPMTAPAALSSAENPPVLRLQATGSALKLADDSPSYAEVWRTRPFGAGIGTTGIWSADLDNDGDDDLVLSGGNSFWSIVAFDDATGEYDIRWQSAPYTPATITAMRVVEVGNTRRIWVGLSDGRIDVVDGSTRELVDTLTTGNEVVRDFSIADADNNGAIDAVAITNSRLLLYDPVTLGLRNEFPYGGARIAVGNVDADSAIEVVLNTGFVLEIDGDNAVVQWNTTEFGARIDLGDVDGDGMAELVAAKAWYDIQAWDLDMQSSKWSIHADLNIDAMRLIDVSGDSAPELLYGDGQWGSIHAIDTTSLATLWSVENPEHGVTAIAVIDSDNDGAHELLWGSGWTSSGPDYLYVHDLATGSLEWRSADYSGPFHAVDIGDVDADGETEIVIASFESESGYADGQVMVFDAATHVLEWRSETDTFGGHAWTGVHDLKLANVDEDPQLEIMVGTDRLYDGALYVIDGLTHEMQNFAFYDSGSPLMVLDTADLTGDGRPEVIAGNGVAHTGSPGVFIYVLDPLSDDVVWQSAIVASGFSTMTDVRAADVGGAGMDLIAASSNIHAVRWSDKRHLTSATTGYLSVAAGNLSGSVELEVLGGRSDGAIDVLDSETLAVVTSYDVCAEPVTALEMLPSSRLLATCGNSLIVYDFTTATVASATESGASSVGGNGALATGVVNGRAVVLTGGTQAVKFVDVSNNQVPVLTPPSNATVHWRDAIDIQLLATDGDGDALTFEFVSLPSLGTAVWLDAELGELRYTSGGVATGLDSMVVRVADGIQHSSPQMLEIILENTPPWANTPTLELHWRGTQTASLVAADPDGDPLAFTLTAEPAQGTAELDPATGALTYTPTDTFVGQDSLSYAATDGADAITEAVQILLTNASPTASAREYQVSPGVAIASRFPAEDANGDPLSYALVSEPTQGELTFESGTGLFEYTPDASGSGTDSLTFEVDDGIAQAQATIQFRYPPAAQNPGGNGGGGGGGSLGWLLPVLIAITCSLRRRRVRQHALLSARGILRQVPILKRLPISRRRRTVAARRHLFAREPRDSYS